MRVSERAAQVWSILAFAATHRQELTYDIVAKLTGLARQGLGPVLEPIQSYCIERRLPPLTILVVKADTGLPGSGFIAAIDYPREQLRVFSHDWLNEPVPTPEQLEEAARRTPSNGRPEALKEVSRAT